jgi:hypothetical protein
MDIDEKVQDEELLTLAETEELNDQSIFYLKAVGNEVVCYTNKETAIEDCGGWDATCTKAEWDSGGCYASVVNGQIVVGKTEEQKKEDLAELFRSARYSRLRECDKISPMRWDAMSEEKKQAWREYRQELLDLPNRPGFPWDGPDYYLEWPIKPE